jgi:flagellar biosynthetic protein FliO
MSMTQVAALAAVFLLLGGALWWLRRAGFAAGGRGPAGAGPRAMERVGRLTLGPHHRLELVRLGDRVMVIGVGASGCSLLHTVGWGELAPRAQDERPLAADGRG